MRWQEKDTSGWYLRTFAVPKKCWACSHMIWLEAMWHWNAGNQWGFWRDDPVCQTCMPDPAVKTLFGSEPHPSVKVYR